MGSDIARRDGGEPSDRRAATSPPASSAAATIEYWVDRERGVLNAYSALVDHRAGTHTALAGQSAGRCCPAIGRVAQPTVLGSITAAEYDLRTALESRRCFFRLGDYQEQCLWEQTNGCSQHNPNPPAPPYVAVTIACPGDATSGKLACATPAPAQQVDDTALGGALEAAIERYRPTTVGMLDASGVFFDALGGAGDSAGYTEYPDHVLLGALRAVGDAARGCGHRRAPAIASYRGYTIAREPPNLTDSVACTKDLGVRRVCAVRSGRRLPSTRSTRSTIRQSYQRRSYPLHTVPPRSERVARPEWLPRHRRVGDRDGRMLGRAGVDARCHRATLESGRSACARSTTVVTSCGR